MPRDNPEKKPDSLEVIDLLKKSIIRNKGNNDMIIKGVADLVDMVRIGTISQRQCELAIQFLIDEEDMTPGHFSQGMKLSYTRTPENRE